MYKYFISFVYVEQSLNIFGNCIINVQKKILTYDDILEIEKQIQYTENIKALPIILSYERMYEE